QSSELELTEFSKHLGIVRAFYDCHAADARAAAYLDLQAADIRIVNLEGCRLAVEGDLLGGNDEGGEAPRSEAFDTKLAVSVGAVVCKSKATDVRLLSGECSVPVLKVCHRLSGFGIDHVAGCDVAL